MSDTAYRKDDYKCGCCGSLGRWRALLHVLQERFPNWRDLSVHESSPAGPASEKFFQECPRYLPTHLFPDRARGDVVNGVRCEDLAAQTFPARRFDLVITSDVIEHVRRPRDAFIEIARTLKPGGAHVFTVPWSSDRTTTLRTRFEGESPVHLHPAEYHENPIDPKGALVVTEWGRELPFWIHEWSGLTTTVYRIRDPKLGLRGPAGDVFVSCKPPI